LGKTAAGFGAFFLVLAFALAALMSPFQTLAELLLIARPGWLDWLNQPTPSGIAGAIWTNIVMPVLVRPDWLLPMMIGLICVGIAVQITWGRK
jgi:hypothetical protein